MKNVTIYGVGKEGKKFYFWLKYYSNFEINVECFYDNNSELWGEHFDGIEIKKYVSNNNSTIVIATENYFAEIAKQLMNYGLVWGKDFFYYLDIMDKKESISYWILNNMCRVIDRDIVFSSFAKNKKFAVVYGNCNTITISQLLMKHNKFTKDYIVIDIPSIYQDWAGLENEKQKWLSCNTFWERVELFIYQKIWSTNRFDEKLGSDELIGKLPKNAILINIPFLQFFGYFPQYKLIVPQGNIKEHVGSELVNVPNRGLFGKDNYIIELIKEGCSEEQVFNLLKSDDFIDCSKIEENLKNSFRILKILDEKTDIHIHDYIEDHYADEQLFYDAGHPNLRVLLELSNRIIEYLGYNRENYDSNCINRVAVSYQAVPVYPCVRKCLGLNNVLDIIYPHPKFYPDVAFDFEQYVRHYYRMVRKKIYENQILGDEII